METTKLYAELLSNPRSLVAYRALIAKYKICNLQNEANAIEELIQRKFDVNSTLIDQEQLQNIAKIP
jgi:hypothetical protein